MYYNDKRETCIHDSDELNNVCLFYLSLLLKFVASLRLFVSVVLLELNTTAAAVPTNEVEERRRRAERGGLRLTEAALSQLLALRMAAMRDVALVPQRSSADR